VPDRQSLGRDSSLPRGWTLGTGEGPRSLCILGGEQLHQDGSYIVSLVTPQQVEQVAEALRPLDREWFRARYFKIDPADYGVPGMLNEQDFEYTWDYFEGVRKFYQKTANDRRWVIFTVDQ
jgi:hypothetical protein